MELNNITSELGNLLTTISDITDVEYAIFSSNAELLTGTPKYLQIKGRNVHFDSINEVLVQGNVIVHKPGMMQSCMGCRFANNCPSTIELLLSVDILGEPIGVVSMTSFSKEGHNRIEKNIRKYLNVLQGIRDLIVIMASSNAQSNHNLMLHSVIDGLMATQDAQYLIIDKNGFVLHRNEVDNIAQTVCLQNANNIDYVLPAQISNWVRGVQTYKQKYFSLDHFCGTVFLEPIFVDKTVFGYIIRIEEDTVDIESNQDVSLDSIISRDEKMLDIKEMIVKVANSKSAVLITGETGTGKEMVAKAIHRASNCYDAPFIPINCASIPDSLFESELFGYEEGAFTGARKGGKPGILEMANNGTVFFDEIGELPVHLQSKLLRVLQDKTIRRVGGIVDIPVKMRVISATNQNLEDLINQEKFREDLYYRLNVIPILIPPLNQRKNDIEPLAFHFLEKHNRILGRKVKTIGEMALKALINYPWPGNIRELENALEYSINMCTDSVIEVGDLPVKMRSKTLQNLSIHEEKELFEKQRLIELMDMYGNDGQAKKIIAKEMNISIRTLYRKLKNHQLA